VLPSKQASRTFCALAVSQLGSRRLGCVPELVDFWYRFLCTSYVSKTQMPQDKLDESVCRILLGTCEESVRSKSLVHIFSRHSASRNGKRRVFSDSYRHIQSKLYFRNSKRSSRRSFALSLEFQQRTVAASICSRSCPFPKGRTDSSRS